MLETSIVVNRKKGSAGIDILRRFIAVAEIQIAEFTESHANVAFEAHRHFGKGMGHPAQLNILDCCAYAFAIQRGEQLLFRGRDFDKNDVAAVQ